MDEWLAACVRSSQDVKGPQRRRREWIVAEGRRKAREQNRNRRQGGVFSTQMA